MPRLSAVHPFVRPCLVALLVATGCSGRIGDAPRGASAPGPGGPGGPGGAGAAACTGAPTAGPGPLRRLTGEEYDATVRDLLRDETLSPARDFVSDSTVGPFTTNVGAPVSTAVAREYMDAASELAAVAAGRLGDLAPCAAALGDEDACARELIASFGRRAYRRPLSDAEAARYLALYTQARTTRGEGFSEALRVVIVAILQAPSFLYHVELGDAAARSGDLVPLTPYELASRLSYFIWGTMPDDELFEAAARGGLADDAGVEATVRRMLEGDRGRAGIRRFFDQWLGLARVDALEKSDALFPEFTDELRAAMREETEAFIDYVVWSGDSKLSTLLTARFGYVNDALASLYGLDGVTGPELRLVDDLGPERRAGLLTQASFLAANAHPEQTSPVHRGKFVREILLCQSMPPPPPDVVVTAPAPDPSATTRERFSEHSADPYCASCHVLMDPIGLGFERYDAIGRYRDTENGLPIDASGEVVSSEDVDGAFVGPAELGARLASSGQVHACAVRQIFRFALGRDPEEADACGLATIAERFRASGGDLRELVVALATSEAFRTIRAPIVEGCE